jgi:2,3,4,5-tetrahydropyridine-2-carboxylate N-succinyltransferase
MSYKELQATIEDAFESRAKITPQNASDEVRAAVETVLGLLDAGNLRVADRLAGTWRVNEWLKKAVLLSFRIEDSVPLQAGTLNFYDKVPLKFDGWDAARFAAAGVRVVPPATVRRGAFIASNVVLMPSYVNIGAYVGKNVHLSGGVGIGGVLEPLQAAPTIIEDNCFVGARSEIVEGVIVESGAVISMGVFIGQSTRIYDRERDEILYGRVPSGAVVVPGTLPAKNGKYGLSCAVIVKRVDAQTRAKTSLNELLRNTD